VRAQPRHQSIRSSAGRPLDALPLPPRRGGGRRERLRLVENAVGAHLLSGLSGDELGVTYWRDGAEEVDVVVTHGKRIWAIEVKRGRSGKVAGLAAFAKRYPRAQSWLIGSDGAPLKEFFARPATDWFK